MKEKALKSIGLTDKEIKVYIASLKLGYSLVQYIAKDAEVNRTSTYDLLQSLEEKGFVSHTIELGKRYYQATPPKNLLGLFQEKQEMLKQAIPELIQLSQLFIKKPKVEVYIGVNGIKTALQNVLEEAKSFLCFASKKYLLKLLKYYIPHFVEERKKRGIKIKLITDEAPLDPKAPHKIINANIKTAIWIYNDKLLMISLEKEQPIAIMIQEKNVVKTHEFMFESLWKIAK